MTRKQPFSRWEFHAARKSPPFAGRLWLLYGEWLRAYPQLAEEIQIHWYLKR